jgi:RHS repeat-associated protein
MLTLINHSAVPNYTGEYSGDYNELLYLRSRYYSPSIGRFLTKDSWLGDFVRPLSLNRWMYTEGNPVNFTDPSGRSITPRFSCQMMPTKALYELCILGHYDLEPISYFRLGESVQGQPGCYSGPSEYRAPGYLEGVEGHIGGIPSYTTGLEMLYDFANMQRARFKFQGITVNDGLVGGGVSVYFGKALGLRSDRSLPDYYKDVSLSGSVGMSFDVIIGGAIGRGGFVALSSETLPMLRGNTWYTGASVSGDALEGLDLSGSWVNYIPVSAEPDRYVVGGKLNEAKLYADITSGAESPWESQWEFIGNYPPILVDKMIVRAYGLYLGHKYVSAYKELHNENP